MMPLEFRLLGPLEVLCRGVAVPIGASRQRVLLASLLTDANRTIPAGELYRRLWDADLPADARTTLQTYVSRLRRALAPAGAAGLVVTRPGGYLIEVDGEALDITRFRRMVADARTVREKQDPERASNLLGEALALWRGDALADIASDVLHRAAVPALTEERLDAIEMRVEADLCLGRHRDLIPELSDLAARYPLRERFWAQRMLALYRSGRPSEALACYRALAAHLADELGTDPTRALHDLHQAILTSDPALMAPPAAGPRIAEPGRRVPLQDWVPAPRQAPTGPAEERVAHADRERGGSHQQNPAHDPRPATAGPGQPECGPADGGHSGPEHAEPRQLPAGMAGFTGRADELKALSELAGEAAGGTGTVVISAISGMAGIGKTALALHWAHQMAGRFPGGQLYANLRGFDPSGAPATPAEVIRAFLPGLGVLPERIPAGQEAQAGLYRTMLAGRQVMIVLDNARDAAQVRPLLPGSPGCMVVVTSRRPLTPLAAGHGARLVSLGLLTNDEAAELLSARLGPERVAAEQAATAELVTLCGRLPLALAITAARAAGRPGLPLAVFAAELRDARQRLDALDAGDPASNLRAVFSWSCQELTAPAAELFRLLGVHPGPDISMAATASLAGTALTEAGSAMRELTALHLVTEHHPGRYILHDLVRAYAAELARATMPDSQRRAAIHRALDHYLHTARSADAQLRPLRHPITLAAPQDGTTPENLSGRRQVMDWFDAEHQVLLAATALAADAQFDTHAWQLPWNLADYLDRHGHWHDCDVVLRTALAAARRLADQDAQARVHCAIGRVCVKFGPGQEARSHFEQALRLYCDLDDRVGQARAHGELSTAFAIQDRHHEALAHSERALELSSSAGHPHVKAAMLNKVGWHAAHLGDYEYALACCQQALDLLRDLGNRYSEAYVWDSLGYIHQHLRRYAQSIGCFNRAVSLFREFGNRYELSATLGNLGDACQAAGQPTAARDAWQRALAILDDLHHPDAAALRARLRAHDADRSIST
jgi:DNA-binding SARP family transcriptional activator/tetratricopeptide (TPR) repeat protein